MILKLHPRVHNDLRDILDYYDRRSGNAGDRLFSEFELALEQIEGNPEGFHLVDSERRRCNLKRFPYHLIYEVHGKETADSHTYSQIHSRHSSGEWFEQTGVSALRADDTAWVVR